MVYVIGNPLTARGILQHNIRGANNVPFRVLITEGADGAGTEIVYNLPSSLIVLEDNEPLRAAAEGLDRNLEAMVERITAV
ncbi:hypothetical protein DFH09DRAFT_1176918 [Mycena vulgaris]|nr:hypothetical protein DFH09DRAFT_1217326 [Mycena vulgaris]KAJ6538451.1 hypothetical protein DFH09DRAFT_1176918 [Mycena vulgaris]